MATLATGTAQAGANGSITLAAGESAVNNFFNQTVVNLVSGTGAGQARPIWDYTGGSKVADVRPDWITNPDNTTVYEIEHAYSVLSDDGQGGVNTVLTLERGIIASVTTDEPGLKITGDNAGAGVLVTGGDLGHGIHTQGGSGATDNDGIRTAGNNAGSGVAAIAGNEGYGVYAKGGASVGEAIYAEAGPDSHGFLAQGADSGAGVYAEGGATGQDMSLGGTDNIAAIWAHIVETTGSITAEHILRATLAFIAGDRAGGGTATISFKRADGSTNAILMQSVDANGNTSSITLNLG